MLVFYAFYLLITLFPGINNSKKQAFVEENITIVLLAGKLQLKSSALGGRTLK